MILNTVSFAMAAMLAGFNPDFNPALHFAANGYKLVAGDFNGDGRQDFAVHNPYAWDDPSQSFGNLTVYLNSGGGVYTTYSCPLPTYGGQYDLAAADFDGDGCCDLAIASQYACNILRSNGPGGGFTPWASLSFNSPYISFYQLTQMAVGDFDGDGRPDVFVVGFDTNGDLPYAFSSLFLNRGNAVFENPVFYWGWGADVWPLGAADIDGDGVSEWIDNYSNYRFWKYSANQINLVGTAPSGGDWGSIVSADFNRDGFVDLLTLNHLTFGAGGATFASPMPIALGLDGTMRGFAAADFNGDGLPDVAYLTQSGVTIAYNDGRWPTPTAYPLVSINDVDIVEGNSGSSNAVFSVRLSAASTSTVTVSYSTTDGSATAGSDYQATSGTLTFAPGETQKPINVRIYGDTKYEPDEYFVVNLTSVTGAAFADNQAVGLIRNDDANNIPVVSICNVSKAEVNNGNTTFTFQVTLSAASSGTIKVSYRTVDGTAKIANNDYVAASGTLTFSPGQTSKTIAVTVKGDRNREPNEVFYVDLIGVSANATLGQSRGTGTILNDD